MRVLIAPDSFGDTLTAVDAAQAIASGWSRARPGDDVVCAPLSDGGPGFVQVLASRLGRVHTTRVTGPLGDPVDAQWLFDEAADTATAYVECAQACGLHQVGPPRPETAATAGTRGVGELITAAADAGARRIVVGLGGSAATDGGRGALAALADEPSPDAPGPAVETPAADTPGGRMPSVADVQRARRRLAGVEIVVASDVENPLLGEFGAARVFGPQKGADRATVDELERVMALWSGVLAESGADVAAQAGAGAAGGLGAALLALGGARVAGAAVIAGAIDFDGLLAATDLLITGEGRFDDQTLRGKVVAAAAADSRSHGVPVVAVAGQVRLGADAISAAGIASAHAIVDIADSVEHAMSDAGPLLSQLVTGVAQRWPDRSGTTRRR